MGLFWNILIILSIGVINCSKLNTPRVLLPLFKSSPTNFTLKVTENGCYTWTLSRLDIIQIIPVNQNKNLKCSSEVILSTITKEFMRNTVIVLVEEITTKEVLRCDVIVDVISSLRVVTKTRQLFVEESPEKFETRAYDDQGNEFSTLEGIEFSWMVSSGGHNDLTRKNDVLRFINFKDSFYEIPLTIRDLDSKGSRGHMVLVEGVKTGTANVTVQLDQFEYKHVPPTTVQLNVIANLIIEPSDIHVLRGDIVYYKLLQVKNGRFVEIPLPSAQYSLNIEDSTVAKQFRPWVIEALTVGQTKLILSDVNSHISNSDDKTYLPSVTLNVVLPAYMSLVPVSYGSWTTVLHQPFNIAAELFTNDNYKIHIGPHVHINIDVDRRFEVSKTTTNGSYVYGYPNEIGIIPVKATFKSVTTNDGVLIPFSELNAQADLLVYPPLKINPPVIRIPWDAEISPKLNYPLNATGGDGSYQWSVVNTQVAIVTQMGTVKPRRVGQTEITISMPKNQAIQTSAKIIIQRPTRLAIVRNAIEAEVGSPIFLAVALYYVEETSGIRKQVLFSDCTGFPFDIQIQNFDFFYNASSFVKTPVDACTVLGIIGRNAGSSVITISYRSEATILKDTATISTYERLRILSPETSRTVLAVGAQRYVVFVGGPSRNSIGHRIFMKHDENTITAVETHDRIESERVYLITCQKIGDGHIALHIKSKDDFDDLRAPILHHVDVLCRHPKSVTLSTEIPDARVETCPSMFRSKNVVLNNKPVIVRVTVTDDEENVFDNATSLNYKWTLSDEHLGEVEFPEAIKIQVKDRVKYTLPLYHYQVINPAKKTGTLDATVKVGNYKKSWLKKLQINAENIQFRSNDIQKTLSLNLVNNVVLTPGYISIFNHPQNTVEFLLAEGSGFYNVTTNTGDSAQVDFSKASKSVKITPLLPGSFTVTVKDECLISEPVIARMVIVTISEIHVHVVDKIEKGKTVEGILELRDSEEKLVTKKDQLNLKLEIDSNIISVNIGNEKLGSGIVCTISGLEIGNTNLIFSVGIGNSVMRSKPIRIQVYPPLKIIPGNITLIPGAVLQLAAKGGPQPDCLIEYSTGNNAITVDNAGNVVGKQLGRGHVVGKATGKVNGKKVTYSSDTIYVNVVHLDGIRIKTPLVRIEAGAKMPIWVEGIPEQISPLVLASVQPPIQFKWEVSSPFQAQLVHTFEETGIKILDSDKASMKFHAMKPGNIMISVNVTVPHGITAKKNAFIDSVSIEIVDKLQIINYDMGPSLLLAPNMKYQLKTNKDKFAHVSYKVIHEGNTKMELTEEGVISTSTYGFGIFEMNSIEENGYVDNTEVIVKVAPVQYIMLNVIPDFQVGSESSMFGLPRGTKIRFDITYHDNYGRKFYATKNNIKFHLNQIDKIRVAESETANTLDVELLDNGATVLKVFDEDMPLTADYLKINTVSYIQPDKMKFTEGDVICFNMQAAVENDNLCSWNSSNEHSLTVNKHTGLGIARSKQANVIISYYCPNGMKALTTAEIHSLQKIEIAKSKIGNVSNNGKEYTIPLMLLNEEDDETSIIQKNKLLSKFECDIKDSDIHFPYECEIKFKDETTSYDVKTVFRIRPHFDTINGHSCIIESGNVTSPILSKIDTNILLKVTWGRYQSISVPIHFKPAVYVDTLTLQITDSKPIDIVNVVGLPSVLDQIQVVLSDDRYIGLTEESSDNQNVLKFSVYLKSAYLKQTCGSPPELSISLNSEVTEQHIKIPIGANVNADQYVTPNYLTDEINYFLNHYALKVLLSAIAGALIYLGIYKIYKKMFESSKDDSIHLNLSHNRSNLSDHSSPLYRRSPHRYNEIQMIYGRSDRTR